MYFAYAIFNRKHRKIYVGQTGNLEKRMAVHDSKDFPNSYTARFDGVWELIYSEEVANRKDALKREKQLKSYKGREFLKQYIPA